MPHARRDIQCAAVAEVCSVHVLVSGDQGSAEQLHLAAMRVCGQALELGVLRLQLAQTLCIRGLHTELHVDLAEQQLNISQSDWMLQHASAAALRCIWAQALDLAGGMAQAGVGGWGPGMLEERTDVLVTGHLGRSGAIREILQLRQQMAELAIKLDAERSQTRVGVEKAEERAAGAERRAALHIEAERAARSQADERAAAATKRAE